jgi:hypothetical protein
LASLDEYSVLECLLVRTRVSTQAYIRPQDKNYKDIGRVDRVWEKVGHYIYQSMNSVAEESHGRHNDKWAK